MPSRAGLLVFVTGALFLASCGPANMARVSGRVTCRGKPVAEAVITFSPMPKNEGDRESGKAAAGSTDADGKYVLTTFRQGDGALIGNHRVSITLDEHDHSGCKSRVYTREVKAGGGEINIDLSE
jgi:hypothetical protein